MNTTYIDAISHLPVFAGIERRDMGGMLACLGSFVRQYHKGEYILLEEDSVTSVGVVLEGCVHMSKEDLWGHKTILAFIKKDELFGESFVCSQSKAAVTFYAATEVEILFLPFHRVMSSCSNACVFHQRLIENMVVQIANKNRLLVEKLEVVSKKTLRERVLTYLSMMAQQCGSNYFELPMGRMEMADYLCADRSALSRELSNMKAEGLIDYEKNTFRVLK